MTTNIVRHEYNGFSIQQRVFDDFVCLTDMAKVEGRRVGDYLDQVSTKEYIAALAEDLNQLPVWLVIGVRGQNGGTWAHPEIAIDFAQWVSVSFRIWANRTLVKVVKDQSAPPPLPPADIRLASYTDSLKFLSESVGLELDNPRYQQELKDFAVNLIIGNQKQISVDDSQWLGVVEVAIDMGYAASIANKHRISLGRFIATHDLESRKEKRLCNGSMQPINLYLDCLELREAVAEFMDAKVLAA